ncbi:putative transcription factor interactor and regulator CCHC(Zn) family [Arabidopsis thaliana]
MAIDTIQKTKKLRWGEIDEEEGDYDFLLPPKQMISPDQNGVKKVIEYKFNEEDKKVKITTTTRVQKRALTKQAVERRSWNKFGDAAHEESSSYLTMRSTEDIILERIRAPGSNAEQSTVSGDSMSQLGKPGAVLMVCRLCQKKGDHWTSRCPQKDLLSLMDEPLTAETSTSTITGTGRAAYVPPSMREGADRKAGGSDMRSRHDENSVRVTNLSEDTRGPDLMELFRPFGAVTRCHVAIDQKTSMSRGFGFVSFVSREDAQRAINKLNGYGYDNLILRVEWSTPKPQLDPFSFADYNNLCKLLNICHS